MASYDQQKETAFARLKVNKKDLPRIQKGQFTLFDFIEHNFSFSPKRRQLAVQVLELLKGSNKSTGGPASRQDAPKRFSDLQKQINSQKSSLHLVLSALENSGLVEKTGEGFLLSPSFTALLDQYALFWKKWLEQKP
ncbi:hypothetical protein HZC09_05075 [Candidatus Micrarchaeota archaeon]|nr:hypothetical protein [Candidatus Micrarchaeota archaeon]